MFRGLPLLRKDTRMPVVARDGGEPSRGATAVDSISKVEALVGRRRC